MEKLSSKLPSTKGLTGTAIKDNPFKNMFHKEDEEYHSAILNRRLIVTYNALLYYLCGSNTICHDTVESITTLIR